MTHKEQHFPPQALELSDDELAGLSAGVDEDSIRRVQGLIDENMKNMEAACKAYSEAERIGDDSGMRRHQKTINDCLHLRAAYTKVREALRS